MSRNLLPAAILILSQTAALLAFYLSAPYLPARIASHFNAAGAPDGWMSRDTYLWTMAVLSLGMTAFMLAIFYFTRFFPDSMINLPNRDYWLAPERRKRTCDTLFRYGLWFAILLTGFFAAVHATIVAANARKPPNLSAAVWINLVILLATSTTWSILLVREFKKPAEALT